MKMVVNIAESYKRARHSRGFGVHSPFAFRIVNLLRLGRSWGFYAEQEIAERALSEGGRRLRRDALRFHRLCASFADGGIYVSPSSPRSVALAASLASSRLRITGCDKRLCECLAAYFVAGHDGVPRIVHAMNDGCSFAMLSGFSDAEVMEIAESSGIALALLGKRNSFLFNRKGMHRVFYTVNL